MANRAQHPANVTTAQSPVAFLDAKALRLLQHLWREGAKVYWWTDKGRRSYWFQPDSLRTPPTTPGVNVYFGVHPCTAVPATNAAGEVRTPAYVRSQIASIAAINCLFAEYDAKDFADGKDGAKSHIKALPAAPTAIVDSGGGYHCYWLLREPLRLQTAVERSQAAELQARWVGFVGSDIGAKDLARVLRVPGTRNWKPERGPDFPLVKIVSADFDRLYDLGELEELMGASTLTAMPQLPSQRSQAATAQERYVQRAVDDELDKLARVNEGGRNHQLNRSAFALGQLVGAGVLPRSDAEDKLIAVAQAIGLPAGEARRTITSGLSAGEQEPRQLPSFREHRNGQAPALPAPITQHFGKNGQAAPHQNGANASDKAEMSEAIQAPDLAIADDMIDRGKHDLGNAYFAYQQDGKHVMYTDGLGWLFWTGTHWETDTAAARVHRIITHALKERCRIALAKEDTDTDLLKAATPSARHTRDATYHFQHLVTRSTEDFDNIPHLLNCKNGVVDLQTGDLVAHDSSNRFTYCVPTEYTPGERSELWERLLLDWFLGNHDLIQYVRRAMGYSITGETREECLFYLRGPGRAGKGTLVNTPTQILGHELAKGIQFDAFTVANDAQNFRLAPLRNARFVSASESKQGERLDEALVKQLTGRDPINAAFKFKTPFTFIPRFKVWLLSNYAPRGDTDDSAFWYRVRLLQMTKNNLGTEDNTLKDTLLTAEHRKGILAWLVYGAMKWYETGLGTPKAVWEATENARREQDPVEQWLNECTVDRHDTPLSPTERYYTSMTLLYDNYTQWCKDTGIRFPLAKNTLCRKLSQKGFDNLRTREGMAIVTKVYDLQLQEMQ